MKRYILALLVSFTSLLYSSCNTRVPDIHGTWLVDEVYNKEKGKYVDSEIIGFFIIEKDDPEIYFTRFIRKCTLSYEIKEINDTLKIDLKSKDGVIDPVFNGEFTLTKESERIMNFENKHYKIQLSTLM